MNDNQDNSQDITKSTAKWKNPIAIWIAVCGTLALGLLICLAHFAGAKPKTNVPPSNSAISANNITGNPVTPLAPVPAPSYTSHSTPAATQPVPPSTPSTNPAPTPQPPPATTSVPQTLISKQAYQMVLTLEDMGPGWMNPGNGASPQRSQASSTSYVAFINGNAFSPTVRNEVTVFRTLDAAVKAFDQEKPAVTVNLTLSYPNIGDECFLNDTVPTSQVLVFRKSNVVAWIIIDADKTGDPEHYARIVEQKIIP